MTENSPHNGGAPGYIQFAPDESGKPDSPDHYIEVRITWTYEDGVQVYDNGDPNLGDWVTVPLRCPNCLFKWWGVAAVGGMGIECPACGHVDPFYVWYVPADAVDERVMV